MGVMTGRRYEFERKTMLQNFAILRLLFQKQAFHLKVNKEMHNLSQWVNQFTQEMYSWALHKDTLSPACRRPGAGHFFGCCRKTGRFQRG